MVLFLCSELTIFGVLISTYFYLDFNVRRWPPAGVPNPEVTGPVIATAVLVATAPLMWLAFGACRRGRRWTAIAWIAAGLVFQCAYLGVQIAFFAHDLGDFSPQGSAYGSIYFTLLAAHHAHVLGGILLDLALMWKLARRGLGDYWVIGVRGLALYWSVVGALAIPVLLTVLSPSL
jgi:heme/copper-type cytochrome/quinol oxidase subunit 3